MEKLGLILRITLFSLTCIVLGAVAVVHLPSVQDRLGDEVEAFLNRTLDADVNMEHLRFNGLGSIVIDGLSIIDKQPVQRYGMHGPDTLLYAGTVSTRISIPSIVGGGCVVIRDLTLKNVKMNMALEENIFHNNLKRILRKPYSPDGKDYPDKKIFSIKKFTVRHFDYSLVNLKSKHKDVAAGAVNWGDIQVYDLCLDADHFELDRNIFGANLNRASFREKCGMTVHNLSARADVGKGNVKVSHINLNDGISDLNLDLNLAGRKRAYQHFKEDVVITADIASATVDTRTISHFVPAMGKIKDCKLDLQGKYYGSVTKMMFDRLRIDVHGTDISTTISGGLYGLPEIDKVDVNLKVSETRLRTAQIVRIMKKIGKEPKTDLSRFAPHDILAFDLYTNGNARDLNINLDIKQGWNNGRLKAKVKAWNLLDRKTAAIQVKGAIDAMDVNLAALLGKSTLGRTSFKADFDAALPFHEQPLDAKLTNISVSKFGFRGYNYKNINGTAAIQGKDITADLNITDEALRSDVTLWPSKYEHNASIVVKYADLYKLGIDKRSPSLAGFMIYGHLDKDLKNLKGNAVISDIYLTGQEGTQHISDITLNADNEKGWYNLGMDSDFATASFVGNRSDLRLSLSTFDTRDLLSFVAPGTYIESGTSINVSLDSLGGISGSILSGRFAKGKNNIKNLQADISGTLENAYATIISDEVTLGSITLDNSSLVANLKDRKCMTFDFNFDDKAEKKSSADIHGQATMLSKQNINLEIRPSTLTISGDEWTIPLCRISKAGDDISIDSLRISTDSRWIIADGKISRNGNGKLNVDIKDLDMKKISDLVKPDFGKLDGILNIKGVLFSPLRRHEMPSLNFEIAADSVSLSDRKIGKLGGYCRRIPGQDVMRISLTDSLEGKTPLTLDARMNPQRQTLDGVLSMKSFTIDALQPLFVSLLDDVSGKLSGKILFHKGPDDTNIKSKDINFEDCKFTLGLTGVTYDLTGQMDVNNRGINLDKLRLKDRFGNTGNFKGGLQWKNLKDIRAALSVNLPKIEILNKATATAGSKFYGNAFIGATADIEGPLKDLNIALNVRTLDQSNVHIIISNNLSASKQDMLTFVNPFEDNLPDFYAEQLKLLNRRSGKGHLAMRVHAQVDPRLILNADLSAKAIHSDVTAQGTGDITVEYDSNKKGMNLLGDYVISDGNFTVDAGNIVRRSFNIKDGSSITFGGDLKQSVINLEAMYQTKASIGALIADTTSIANRRLVNCGIQLKNRISDPNLHLSIDIPDLDPSAKAKVESALNTEDKIQKQFLSLLISNNFLPDDQGGVVNNNSMLYSNVSEIMSNQINSIFTKLNIPLDLGFHYQRTNTGGNMFDVALNTQLWNNRIIIGGTVGNRRNMNASTESIFGDLDIQFKVIPSGSLRLKAFSHSADQYTNYLDNSQRNGIGITWHQEFNNFKDWAKRLFSKKEVKARIDEKEALEARKQKIIILDSVSE